MQETSSNPLGEQIKQFEIVALHEKDIPEVLRLADEGGLARWSEDDYLSELRLDWGIALKIYEVETGVMVGFIVTRLITSTDSSQFSHAEILNITVDKKYRKLGLGSTLLRETIQYASDRKHSSVWLEVRQSNALAISFYERHGFIREYLRENLYTSPAEAGWVMKLEL